MVIPVGGNRTVTNSAQVHIYLVSYEHSNTEKDVNRHSAHNTGPPNIKVPTSTAPLLMTDQNIIRKSKLF